MNLRTQSVPLDSLVVVEEKDEILDTFSDVNLDSDRFNSDSDWREYNEEGEKGEQEGEEEEVAYGSCQEGSGDERSRQDSDFDIEELRKEIRGDGFIPFSEVVNRPILDATNDDMVPRFGAQFTETVECVNSDNGSDDSNELDIEELRREIREMFISDQLVSDENNVLQGADLVSVEATSVKAEAARVIAAKAAARAVLGAVDRALVSKFGVFLHDSVFEMSCKNVNVDENGESSGSDLDIEELRREIWRESLVKHFDEAIFRADDANDAVMDLPYSDCDFAVIECDAYVGVDCSENGTINRRNRSFRGIGEKGEEAVGLGDLCHGDS